jgi:hypothetical protein
VTDIGASRALSPPHALSAATRLNRSTKCAAFDDLILEDIQYSVDKLFIEVLECCAFVTLLLSGKLGQCDLAAKLSGKKRF